jgi:hypothetical protein
MYAVCAGPGVLLYSMWAVGCAAVGQKGKEGGRQMQATCMGVSVGLFAVRDLWLWFRTGAPAAAGPALQLGSEQNHAQCTFNAVVHLH